MPPGGYSTGLAEPGARSVQEVWDRGRRVTFTWFDPPFRPEPPHSNQAYGICFTGTGMIVLGACDVDGERYWNLLGGGVEPGETLEDCLVREVMEEGCARVVQSRYPAGYCPAGHGRLRAQNTHLGIGGNRHRA